MTFINKSLLLLPILMLTDCGSVGDKNGSIASIYGATAFFALFILMAYLFFVKTKDRWFLLLSGSILVVNFGYYMLATSDILEKALMANRISYLGSAMLPFSMMFIIFNVCKINYKKWIPWFFFTISFFVFLIAASPGYSDIYYSKVTLEIINGVSILKKTYGPLHSLYLYYLISYFSIIIGTIIYAILNHKTISYAHSFILAVAVFVNICVWLTEQLVKIDFEFLSISYIISESFLLMLQLMVLENNKRIEAFKNSVVKLQDAAEISLKEVKIPEKSSVSISQCQFFATHLNTLTPTEKLVYELYIHGKSSKEILAELNIKENTLKYHNRNIYSKLGVSSRKQLIELANQIKNTAEEH